MYAVAASRSESCMDVFQGEFCQNKRENSGFVVSPIGAGIHFALFILTIRMYFN